MSLLSVVQRACSKSQLPRPSAVIGNQNPQIVELLNYANIEGSELAQAIPWQELITETTFTSLAQAVQTGAIPSDFDRMVPESLYNRTLRRKILGPISPQEWQERQAFPAALTVQWLFRIRGDQLLITPTPPAGNTCAFEYVSNLWCATSDGVTNKAAYTLDTDIARIDETIIAIGVELRWKKAQNLPWDDVQKAYQDQIQKYATKQAGSPTLTIGSRVNRRYGTNVPEGNFPAPV